MSAQPQLVFKFATEEWEFEEIHRLNYKTFVQEIPQHQASPSDEPFLGLGSPPRL